MAAAGTIFALALSLLRQVLARPLQRGTLAKCVSKRFPGGCLKKFSQIVNRLKFRLKKKIQARLLRAGASTN
jgi:hypothetical protein